MAYNIVMPQLSDSMNEGKLISWRVKVGDRVRVGDVIAEVESDKAIMEIQSFKDGVVKELKVKEGEEAPVGEPIAIIEETKAKETNLQKEEPKKERPKEDIELEYKEDIKSPTPKPINQANPDTKKSQESIIDQVFNKDFTPNVDGVASPKAKILAKEYAIDIQILQERGELPKPTHKEDIENYYLKRYFTPKALKLIKDYQLPLKSFPKGKKYTEDDILEYISKHNIPKISIISSMRKAIISTVSSAQQKPVYHIYDSIDAKLLKEYESDRYTLTVWLLKLFAEAMMRHKSFRTTLSQDKILSYPNASISLAIRSKDGGLYMPVLRSLNLKSIQEISSELAELKERSFLKTLKSEDFRGSTFGISNLGMTGVERFDAMINGDDCAIVAIGGEKDGRIAITLTIDHRLIDGWEGAKFMQTLKELAQNEQLFKEN